MSKVENQNPMSKEKKYIYTYILIALILLTFGLFYYYKKSTFLEWWNKSPFSFKSEKETENLREYNSLDNSSEASVPPNNSQETIVPPENISINTEETSTESKEDKINETFDKQLDITKEDVNAHNQEIINQAQGIDNKIDRLEEKIGKIIDSNYEEINLDDYRRSLLNINNIIINFLKDKAYTTQLEIAKTLKLPKEIEIILSLFDKYNKIYLINCNQQRHKIFPYKSRLLDKFIKIEKASTNLKDKEILKKEIMENLELFTDYIFSEGFFKMFTNRVVK